MLPHSSCIFEMRWCVCMFVRGVNAAQVMWGDRKMGHPLITTVECSTRSTYRAQPQTIAASYKDFARFNASPQSVTFKDGPLHYLSCTNVDESTGRVCHYRNDADDCCPKCAVGVPPVSWFTMATLKNNINANYTRRPGKRSYRGARRTPSKKVLDIVF